MAPQNGGGGIDKDAKHALDRIGAEVQKIAHDAAVDYISDLKGDLSNAKFLDGGNVQYPHKDPCELTHTYDTNVSWGVIHPCDNRLANLFTEESASQCSTSRISGNDTNSGSCAPYRKLQLCDYNLEKITDTNVTNTHNLLVDVLLAAKYEGDSLSKYRNEHPDIIPSSNICTVLARSFADIGDIIRGKDLYVGNRKEREKEELQKNLKTIFKKIYGELKNFKAVERYKDGNGNYYKLREDWWNINRQQVWKAITCNVENAKYFRQTCGGGSTATTTQCRCINSDVPTYLDYVPQHLRWFEEWAEEFCRIKQHKLQKLEKVCRGDNEDKKYCSRNGYDCTGTIIKRKKFRPDPECTNCLFECNHYQDWIDNKMEEFKKQKQKCENEIYKTSTTNKRTNNNVNVMYYKDFYKELQGRYRTINELLNSLNEETKCKSIEKTDNESKIDFNYIDSTFHHSKYCKPCPDCGVVKQDDGNFRVRTDDEPECQGENDNTTPHGVNTTNIEVLYSGDGKDDVIKKLKEFCSKPDDQYGIKNEKWECYYKSSVDNKCIMQTNNQKVESHSKIMKFDEFFIFWVTYMLNDCIDWKKNITKCINSGMKWRCKNKCKNNCNCFEKWVKKKQDEWKHIKEQYDNQPDLPTKHHFGIREKFLEIEFFPLIKKAYGNEDAIEKIQEFLEKKSKKEDSEIVDKRDIIDILLEHELEEAQECKDYNPHDEKCPEQSKEEQDSEDEDDDEPPRTRNPCVDKNGSEPTKTVTHVARQLHRRAKAQMTKNSVVDDENKLKGDVSDVTFRNGGKGSDFIGEKICNINTTHSNDYRGTAGGPCIGKDGDHGGVRMKIGTKWSYIEENPTLYKDFYLPPRRQHMCTSNLEKLHVESVTKNDKAIHSLLGDVLLTAKMDAEEIIKRYAKQNGKKDVKDLTTPKDHQSICRAVRYSFADLGDIIRGRDLWDKNSDATGLQGNLERIFGHIYKSFPDIKEKYNGDDKKKPKYKQLREDWWEANRRQVWQAMKCEISQLKDKSGPQSSLRDHCGYSDHTPLDDYIPQRLRWMTEWAEWFCKMQSQEYENLVASCKGCKNKEDGKGCMQNTQECDTCTQACEAYRNKIKKWQEQWNNMLVQYLLLYRNAETTAGHGINSYGGAVGDKDKPVVAFLQELQKVNKSTASKRSKRHITIVDPSSTPKTPYSTAAGYIHQELQQVGCNTQTEFCDQKNGIDNTKYAFKNPPPDYVTACGCNERLVPVPKKPEVPPVKEVDACDIVNIIYKTTNVGKNGINGCYPKNYNGWNCNPGQFEEGHDGACMPPRRKSLCIYNLEHDIKETSTKKDLKEVFIKSAAAETF
ncbi:hypothetical protein PFAG_06095, partial [Plasmodium falciparum Santa Lucia]